MSKLLPVRSLFRRARRFHNDEVGETSVLANIMLLAIAALIVIMLIAFGKTAMGWLKEQWDTITRSGG
jgi:Flp pilus assembly pilin Flp